MGVVTIQDKNMIGSGNGYLQIGASALDLQEMGSLEGNSVETVTREELIIEDGEPKLTIDKRVVRESAQITCTLKEKRLRDVHLQMGLPAANITSEISGDIIITAEKKILYGETWVHLYGDHIKVSPLFALNDGGATPVVYVVNTDYKINTTQGLLRRVSTGTITDGGTVYATYTYTRPGRRKLTSGGDASMVTNKYLRFVYVHPDNTYRDITEYPKASPGPSTVQNFNSGAMNTRELAFTAIADQTQSEGERLRIQYHEGSVILP